MATHASKQLIDELVHQFKDPYAFYRELIQNSIDAGAQRIEVRLSFHPTASQGLATAQVADWGEGMNRDVIERYLLTKFRSAKANDLTKIGKFGIGFVSLFAAEPDAVTVDTGRDGEYWRVLFDAEKRYRLIALAQPVEGTSVTLHKTMTAKAYDALVARSLEAVKTWCRHSEVEVLFAAGPAGGGPAPEPTPIREPLRIDGPFQIEHREDGTHLVLGPPWKTPAITGFYNRGLTLLETTEPFVEGVAVKVVSKHLEHTLTRDSVRKDEGWAYVKKLATSLAKGALMKALPEALKSAAARPDGARDFATLWSFAAPRLPRHALHLRAPKGGALPFRQVAKATRATTSLAISVERTPLVERLLAHGFPVAEGAVGSDVVESLEPYLGASGHALAGGLYTCAVPPDGVLPGLDAALRPLLEQLGVRTSQLAVATLLGANETRPFARIEAIGRPLLRDAASSSPFAWRGPPVLCFNRSHDGVAAALGLFTTVPKLAALLLARVVAVQRPWRRGADEALIEWALS